MKSPIIRSRDIFRSNVLFSFLLNTAFAFAIEQYNTGEHEIIPTFVAGMNGVNGCMFTIRALQNISIKSLSFYTEASFPTDVTVSVYTKSDTSPGLEADLDAWTLITHNQTIVQSKGPGFATRIPSENFSALNVFKQHEQSFFLNLTANRILYTNVNKPVGMVYESNDDMEMLVGAGEENDLLDLDNMYQSMVCNAAVHYELVAGTAATADPVRASPGLSNLRRTAVSSEPEELTDSSSSPAFGETSLNFTIKKNIKTSFKGRNGSNGCMFDIVSKEHDILVEALEFKTDIYPVPISVQVYSKTGSLFDSLGSKLDASKWTLIANTTVLGAGLEGGVGTLIPSDVFTSVHIKAHSVHTFYITSPYAYIRYTNMDPLGSTFSQNNDMKILIGAGVSGHPFGEMYRGRLFNGVVHYSAPKSSDDNSNIQEGVVTQQWIQIDVSLDVTLAEDTIQYFESATKEFLNKLLVSNNPPIKITSVTVDRSVTFEDVTIEERRRAATKFANSVQNLIHEISPPPLSTSRQQAERIPLDFYTTIRGECGPYPSINFGTVLRNIFDLKGNEFLKELKDHPIFGHALEINTKIVTFPLSSSSPPPLSDTNLFTNALDGLQKANKYLRLTVFILCGVGGFGIIVSCLCFTTLILKKRKFAETRRKAISDGEDEESLGEAHDEEHDESHSAPKRPRLLHSSSGRRSALFGVSQTSKTEENRRPRLLNSSSGRRSALFGVSQTSEIETEGRRHLSHSSSGRRSAVFGVSQTSETKTEARGKPRAPYSSSSKRPSGVSTERKKRVSPKRGSREESTKGTESHRNPHHRRS